MALLIQPSSWLSLVCSMMNSMSKLHRCLQLISKSTAMMIYLTYVAMPPRHANYIVLISLLLKMPRVRQLPISTYFDPNPLLSYASDAQPRVETLVEEVMPTQPTSDGPVVKFWYPSQVGMGPISHDSGQEHKLQYREPEGSVFLHNRWTTSRRQWIYSTPLKSAWYSPNFFFFPSFVF